MNIPQAAPSPPSVIQPFTVTPLSVAIDGVVTDGVQATSVAGALVRVGLGDGTRSAVATVTNARGAYTLYMQQGDSTVLPGTFSFIAADRPGFVTLRNLYAPITAGQNQTANVSLLADGAPGVLAQAMVRNNSAQPPTPVVGVAIAVKLDSIGAPNIAGLMTTTDQWGRFRLFIPFTAVTPGRTFLYGAQFRSGYFAGVRLPMPSTAAYETTGFDQPNAGP